MQAKRVGQKGDFPTIAGIHVNPQGGRVVIQTCGIAVPSQRSATRCRVIVAAPAIREARDQNELMASEHMPSACRMTRCAFAEYSLALIKVLRFRDSGISDCQYVKQ